jgi:hypothetical protein
MFVSSDAFDNSTFFYEKLKFTWLVQIVIAVEFSGEVDAPSWDPIRFTTPLTSLLNGLFPPAKLVINVSALAIAHSFSIGKRNGGILTGT